MLSPKSKERLDTCDDRIRVVIAKAARIVPKELDFTVLCGHRGKEEQDKAFAEGNSKLKWPNSRHNSTPSQAIDLVPYPIDWKDIDRFYKTATWIFKAAQEEGIELSWGGHWTWKDYPHWELKDG